MNGPKRTTKTTIYLDRDLHRALKIRAAAGDRSMTDLINEAVRARLSEDEADLRAFRDRANEPEMAFAGFITSLKRIGKI